MFTMEGKLSMVVLLVTSASFLYAPVNSQTLYDNNAPVEQLTTETAPGVLYGSNKAWIVEFYASWCGHCQRFAPVWLEFANQLRGWNGVIGVAAIACSDPVNAAICRRFSVHGYPTIKFMEPNAPDDSTGFSYQGPKDLEGLKKTSIKFLQTIQRQGIGQNSWPLLTAYELGTHIWEENPAASRAFLIAANQSDENLLPQQVILESYNLRPGVVVGEISEAGATAATDYQARPALFTVARDGKLFALPSSKTGEEMTEAIASFGNELEDSEDDIKTTSPSSLTTLPPYKAPEGLHMQDLVSSLYYSFWVEVGSHRVLSPSALQALKQHVHVMAKFHPGRPHIVNFLQKTDEWLQGLTEPMSGRKWIDIITKLQSPEAYVLDRVEWTGCAGTVERFRGYPCSLWMTFHALTVRAHQLHGSEPDFDPQEVLSSMKGYVQQFLGCRHCAQHFGRMASTMESEVRLPGDGVMWLWRAHNQANHRLHGDRTEDPRHPKVQFPPPVACHPCRESPAPVSMFDNSTEWDTQHVLEYLTNFYQKDNIIQDALPYTFTTEAPSTVSPTTHLSSAVTSTLSPHRPHPSGQAPAACVPAATPWAPCSVTCGAGTSSRLSNQNLQCQRKMEIRVCYIRPCGANFGDWSSTAEKRESCPTLGTTYRAARPIPIMFSNCRTLASAPWRFCGLCPGKCCFPTNWNSTVWMDVVCGPERAYGKVQVHQVRACQCGDECPP